MENNSKGNGIFLGVIGVATLIVAIIGATFAFFSANANSAENAIQTESTQIALGYQTIKENFKDNLIPAADRLAIYGANTQTGLKECVDDNGNDICSTYTFTIGNPSSTTAQQIYTNITVQTNTFGNLYFALYKVGSDGTVGDQVIGATPFKDPGKTQTGVTYSTNAGGKTVISLDAITQYLGTSETTVPEGDINDMSKYTLKETTINGVPATNMVTYKLVIWIHELKPETGAAPDTDYNQNTADAARAFAAGINVSTSAGGSGVTAVISAAGAP